MFMFKFLTYDFTIGSKESKCYILQWHTQLDKYLDKLGDRHKEADTAKESKRRRGEGEGTLHGEEEAWIKSWVASDIGWIFYAWDHILFPKHKRNSSSGGQDSRAEPRHCLSVCVCATNGTSIIEPRQRHAALAPHTGHSTHVSKLHSEGHTTSVCVCVCVWVILCGKHFAWVDCVWIFCKC